MYLWEVSRECAALMVVPGSHVLPDGPTQTLATPFTNGRNAQQNEGELPMAAFPNHVAVTVGAGDAVMFDSAICERLLPFLGRHFIPHRPIFFAGHGVMPNSSDKPRCSVTLGFNSSRRAPGCTLSQSAQAKLASRPGGICQRQRRLFGTHERPVFLPLCALLYPSPR